VARTAGNRAADRLRVPAAMRRDVRMLGDMLGQVIRESDGDDLLADVEDLRRRVIAAREHDLDDGCEPGGSADDDIAALIASWPVTRAEAVARAFTVYFHLVNLAEEHQRVRTLRERDTGTEPVRESLGAAIAGIAGRLTPGERESLLGRLEVHPVLTAHPTEARRRAVTEALRRISRQLARLDDAQLGAVDRTEASRRLLEEVDLLWRTSQLRIQAMQPLDEVRAGMAIFDETLFELAPRVYRELDRALQGTGTRLSRRRSPTRRRGFRLTTCSGPWRTRPQGSGGH
jgi:phosphoenolpyruvate carboxylase